MSTYNCPDAEVCKTCPCASEDDVCFPGERLRAEREGAVNSDGALRETLGVAITALNEAAERDWERGYKATAEELEEAADDARVALRNVDATVDLFRKQGVWIEDIRTIAQECGYAVGVHGSRTRDLDLIAVPWRDGAVRPADLVERLCVELTLIVADDRWGPYPVEKPWGRVGWVLHGRGQPIDLSVMGPQHIAEAAA